MATHTSFLSLVQAQQRRFHGVKLSIQNVVREMGEGGFRDMKELTSGSIKATTLAKMGHPYGRGPSAGQNLVNANNSGRRGPSASFRKKFPRVPAPLRPLNVQSGRLHSSVGFRTSGKFAVDVSVSAPYARYILHPAGTKKMVGRGVMSWKNVGNYGVTGEIEKRHRARVKAYRLTVQQAMRKP